MGGVRLGTAQVLFAPPFGEKVGGMESPEPKSPVRLQVTYADVPPGTATPVAGRVTKPVAMADVDVANNAANKALCS